MVVKVADRTIRLVAGTVAIGAVVIVLLIVALLRPSMVVVVLYALVVLAVE